MRKCAEQSKDTKKLSSWYCSYYTYYTIINKPVPDRLFYYVGYVLFFCYVRYVDKIDNYYVHYFFLLLGLIIIAFTSTFVRVGFNALTKILLRNFITIIGKHALNFNWQIRFILWLQWIQGPDTFNFSCLSKIIKFFCCIRILQYLILCCIKCWSTFPFFH